MKYRYFLVALLTILFYACSKDYSCENCRPVPLQDSVPIRQPEYPEIASLCGTISVSITAVEHLPYSGTCSITYTGGNGSAYDSGIAIQSSGVTGLTATLVAGRLANGNGTFIYIVTGTPTATGDAIFPISFYGHTCSLVLKVGSSDITLVNAPKVIMATQKERCLAVLPNGIVKAWGGNYYGEVGDGTTLNRKTPMQVNSLTAIYSVAAGAYHSLALGTNGKVWAWGKNNDGQLGNGSATESHTPLPVMTLTDVVAISGGYDYSLALKNDGTVWAWGYNLFGQLGDGTYVSKSHPVQVANLSGIVAIEAGMMHCVALKKDGTVWTWGGNINGVLGNADTIARRSAALPLPGLSGITAVSANGSNHILALKNDGTVWLWGDNSHGQLGDGTAVHRHTPALLAALNNIVAVYTGEENSLVVNNDGTVWGWGWNATGQLGVDYAFNSHQLNPVPVPLLSSIKRIAGGSFHTLFQKNDGTVWAMGSNAFGQLGDGTNTLYRYMPMVVNGL